MKNKLKIKVACLVMAVTVLSMLSYVRIDRIYQMSKFVAPVSADAMKNPVKGDAAATQLGKKTYTSQCVICHGDKGKGDGVASAGLAKPPANHTSAAIQKLSDGALYWMITNGNNPMPAYAAKLSEAQRWQLVNYIRTLAQPAK
jgi:mono/diheme cytochrome c family protein